MSFAKRRHCSIDLEKEITIFCCSAASTFDLRKSRSPSSFSSTILLLATTFCSGGTYSSIFRLLSCFLWSYSKSIKFSFNFQLVTIFEKVSSAFGFVFPVDSNSCFGCVPLNLGDIYAFSLFSFKWTTAGLMYELVFPEKFDSSILIFGSLLVGLSWTVFPPCTSSSCSISTSTIFCFWGRGSSCISLCCVDCPCFLSSL